MKNYYLIGVILTVFFISCSSKKNKKVETVIPKTIGTLITDSVAPPVVTMITAANAPRIIKAAPPTKAPLSYSYGEGVPTITNYGIEDGLPDNNIWASAIDKQGNIWFATSGGLSKYDGIGFTNYTAENGLAASNIRTLFIDSKNNIWIAAGDSLNIFNGRHFTNISFERGTEKLNYVTTIIEDKAGDIWWGTNSGLFKYRDNIITKFTAADGLANDYVTSLIQDKNGNLLISTGNGIIRYDGNSFTPYTAVPANKEGSVPRLLYCDSKGSIWFNNGSGELGKYDGNQIKIYSLKDRDSTSTMIGNTPITFLEDRKGNVWFGGFRELTKFDGNKFIRYAPKDDQASIFHLVSLTEDEYGNIWGGTFLNGIYKINGSFFSKMEIPAGVATGFSIDKQGNKWMYNTEGLGKYNSDHIAYYGKEVFRIGASGLFIDHGGNKWFQAYDIKNKSGVIVKFNDTVFTIFERDKILPGSSIRIYDDNSGNIWLVGLTGGVVKFDGVAFSRYSAAQGLKPRFINCFFQDSKKNIWLGSDSGAYKNDGHRFSFYTVRDGLPGNNVNGITEDGLGQLWFGTNGGAARFDARLNDAVGQGKKFTGYRAIDGLANRIGEVEYDSVNKSIWFNTRIGLASLQMEQAKDEKPLFQHYNPRTGFNFSNPRKLVIDNEGVVWVLDNGISRFDYKSIKDSKSIPVHIKNIRLDNKNISWNSLSRGDYPVGAKDSLTAINEMALKFGKTFSEEYFQIMSDAFGKVSFDSVADSDFIPVNLILPIKNNNISFEFGTISPSFGKAIQYQYKLDGYDKNWSELSNKTEASFGNMSEGKYTFHVKALSPFGSWSETSFSFKVLPPWWRTWWAYALYVLVIASGIFLFIRWRTKALHKEKIILEEKVTTRTSELNQSLENLKATQSQLIQSEKMASLGELTAGIAHEIQNPLNFVNNFSEVSNELLDEMKVEFKKGETDEGFAIADDIKQNLEKILHHGKRADAIVKGMLQHSRSSNGVKESTDINALCDEYLRLSYHGFRAKDKSFNATMKTDFDQSIGNINIIPQDIGRVVLNLINNAFYAAPLPPEVGFKEPNYKHEPTVWVSTKKVGDKVLISVRDNGPGIPQKILDKIFQPFFTTKPTGQGTGLGLSLSYDIVKAHGGELKVETKEGEGSEFIIQLPI
jgi:signal transduction histidine kinase/ligand-binding sensor domain-containing protein